MVSQAVTAVSPVSTWIPVSRLLLQLYYGLHHAIPLLVTPQEQVS